MAKRLAAYRANCIDPQEVIDTIPSMALGLNEIIDPFILPPRVIRETRNEPLTCDNPLAEEVAPALFHADLFVANLAERVGWVRNAPRRCKQHQFLLHLQGDLAILVDGDLRQLSPGELAYHPPGSPSFFTGKEDTTAWFLYLWLSDTPFWEPLKQGGARVRQYESAILLYFLLRKILNAAHTQKPSDILLAQGHAQSILNLLHYERSLACQRPNKKDAALEDLAQAIREDPAFQWDTREMATELGICKRTLTNLFQSRFGMAPKDFVIRQRLSRGIEMLIDTEGTIEQIAFELGYESMQSFSNLFLKYTGIRPGAYRKKHRHEHINEHVDITRPLP